MDPTNKRPLTEIQQAVLKLFEDRRSAGLSAPTLKEICDHFGWASTAAARDHVRALVAKGKLLAGPAKTSRSITLSSPTSQASSLDRSVELNRLMPDGFEAARGHTWTFTNVGNRYRLEGILDGDRVVVGEVSAAVDRKLYVVERRGGPAVATKPGAKEKVLGVVVGVVRSFVRGAPS